MNLEIRIALLACAAAALAVVAGTAAESARDVRFTRGKSALRIPLVDQGSQVLVEAKVNGRKSAWFVVDTGSMGSVLDEALANALGLERTGRQTSFGAGGAQEGTTVRGIGVELPGFLLLDQTMDTLALESLSAGAGRRLDGILGHTLFTRCVVEIDYPRRRMSLYDADHYQYQGRGAILPIEIRETHPYVKARVVFPGGRSIEGSFVIDTGASSSLIISAEQIEKDDLLASVGKTLAVQGQGVGGSAQARLARLERLDLGEASLARPIAVLQSSGAGRVSAPGTVGNIGGGILRRFKVIFDYSRKRMILEPGPDIAAPFEADMSGIGLVTSSPEYRRAIVARVLDGSPGHEAGVRAGDEIESVDGLPAAEIGVPILRERLRREGQTVALVLKRGTETIQLTLRTRRMI